MGHRHTLRMGGCVFPGACSVVTILSQHSGLRGGMRSSSTECQSSLLIFRSRSFSIIHCSSVEMNVLPVQVVANYNGSKQTFDLVAQIHWPGGRTEPPPDVPVCGFDGSLCPPDGVSLCSLYTRN